MTRNEMPPRKVPRYLVHETKTTRALRLLKYLSDGDRTLAQCLRYLGCGQRAFFRSIQVLRTVYDVRRFEGTDGMASRYGVWG